MTWKEIKKAVEGAGVEDDDEISMVQCENQGGKKTLHKTRLGRSLKLSEDVSEDSQDFHGCAT